MLAVAALYAKVKREKGLGCSSVNNGNEKEVYASLRPMSLMKYHASSQDEDC